MIGIGAATHAQKRETTGASEITVSEGTNFAVAVSPDGKTLVIDLQGGLWAMQASGGAAKRITDPLINARQPSFSPSGREIAFHGFWDDGWDLWSVGVDGTNLKRLTFGPLDDQNASWSHDGNRIAFDADRSGNADIWILDVRTGQLQQLTKNPANDTLPTWSPDDREIAFVSARPKQAGVWAINVADGAERLVATVSGRVGPPSWTPDRQQVLYGVVADGLSRLDLSGKPAVTGEDVFPFRPDWISPTEFVYAADGKIKKRPLAGGQPQEIPFSVTMPVKRASYKQKPWDYDTTKSRRALGIVRPAVSPDGKRVAFSALGDIWLTDIGGKPTRLTNDRFLDTDPAWSPDGSQLVYSSDRAANGNLDLYVRDLKSGSEQRITEIQFSDGQASFSPDGKRIAFVSVLSHAQGGEVYVVDLATKKPNRLQRFGGFVPSAPTWSPDGKLVMIATIFRYAQGRAGVYKMMTIPADGGDGKFIEYTPHSSVGLPIDEGPIWSPDGRRVAFVHQGQLKTVVVDNAGNPIGGLHLLTTELAHAPSWTGDSKSIVYLATDQLKKVSVEDGTVQSIPLDVTWRASAGSGRTVIHAGRLWTGRDKTLEADRDIVIEGNRIRSIEPHRAGLHTGRVVDASARTVIPGLIDMHAHLYREYGEAVGRQLLAYGVTTARDVGNEAYRTLEFREAWESGARLGPRLYASGPAWDGTRTSYTEFLTIEPGSRTEMEMERAQKLGFDMFKIYVRLPPLQQKRLIDFAHKSGMHVSSHEIYPAAFLGEDGTEHLYTGGKGSATNIAYDDVIQIIGKSRMTLCPTLAMNSFALMASEDPTLMSDERIKMLAPEWSLTGARSRLERFKDAAKGINDTMTRQVRAALQIARAGGRIVAGTDAPNIPHGQALHLEMEVYVRFGFTPFDALQTATINAAEALGAGADLGTIEPGKVADLVVITGDPLADIKSTRQVSTVIKNGHVIEMNTLLTGGQLATTTQAGR
jgi:Tol biopolymer transport system component/imidazolonepropionase-like amidohydrolase